MTDLRAHDTTRDHTQEEAAIQAVLADSYSAWASGDADAMVADYTEDATAILPGSLRAGREAIRDKMAAAFAGPLKDTTTDNRQLSVRFFGDAAAIVVTESGILFNGQSDVPEEDKVNATWVMHKHDGRWRIAAYHNCPVLA